MDSVKNYKNGKFEKIRTPGTLDKGLSLFARKLPQRKVLTVLTFKIAIK